MSVLQTQIRGHNRTPKPCYMGPWANYRVMELAEGAACCIAASRTSTGTKVIQCVCQSTYYVLGTVWTLSSRK